VAHLRAAIVQACQGMQIMPSAQNFVLWFDRWQNNYAKVCFQNRSG
jgi:hypothetical protein